MRNKKMLKLNEKKCLQTLNYTEEGKIKEYLLYAFITHSTINFFVGGLVIEAII